MFIWAFIRTFELTETHHYSPVVLNTHLACFPCLGGVSNSFWGCQRRQEECLQDSRRPKKKKKSQSCLHTQHLETEDAPSFTWHLLWHFLTPFTWDLCSHISPNLYSSPCLPQQVFQKVRQVPRSARNSFATPSVFEN